MDEFNAETIEEIQSETRDNIEEPPMYRVLLHNDDYTTMQFVVELLVVVFNKPMEEAVQIMLHVHNSGIGVCGIYPCEVAETKVEMVHEIARERGFPLKCTMEKE